MKKTFILAFAFSLMIAFSGNNANAQTKEEAGTAFNEALELSNTNLTGAIVKMQDVIKMCTALGAEGDTIKGKAASVLPIWQYNAGNNLIKEKKYDAAIPVFQKSLDMAVTYSDDNIKEKSESILSKLYANKGNGSYKAQKYDEALGFFDKAVKYDPNYSEAYYTRALAHKSKGDSDKMQEDMDMAITTATKTNDTVFADKVKKVVASNLYKDGAAAVKKKSYSEAVETLNKSVTYDDSNKEVYYLLAVSNNSLKKYDECIAAATTGVALEEQTSAKMARFYYEMAKAYEGKSDTQNACESYKKSAYGAFVQSANYQMKTVLKCQ